MSVYNGSAVVAETIESVLGQTCGDFEFLIIDDGSWDGQVASILARYGAMDERIRVISKRNEGLTVALIEGCRRSGAPYIARVDVGDVMEPDRLAAQHRVLDDYPRCHLVASGVSFHGPAWEELWTGPGRPLVAEPFNAVSSRDGEGLLADIPHHGSAMFRRAAYERVGGYRRAFYYGQDWDLWYRLAETGAVFVIPRVLYRARFFPDAISMACSDRQRRIAELSLAAHQLRKRGLSDQPLLAQAENIRPGNAAAAGERVASAPGYYFIGEALRRRGDPRCRAYLAMAVKACPYSPKSWFRLMQSVAVSG